MVAGNMGTEGRFAYTVMGKTVNFGSILATQNKRYGTQILVNELCYQQCGRSVVGYHVDTVQVRGWTRGERIYTVLGLAAEVDSEYQRGAELFRAGFELYQREQWREATSLFAEAKDLLPRPYHAPHGPAEVMAERCQRLLSSTAEQRMAILQLGSPTERWDGAWRQS
jgi:adenylate cyclase